MIRPYQPSDVDAVVAVWEAATRLAHPFLSEEFLAGERRNLPELYLPNAQTWVAAPAGSVVGFIAMLGSEIGGLFVDPASGRQGVGRALLARVLEDEAELEVDVFEENPIGRAFYAKQGFEPIGRSTHPPTGQVVLRLRLAARPAA